MLKSRLQAVWDDLRSSYWFIPALMTVGALLLAVAAIRLDITFGAAWIDEFPWLYANKPDGARALLSTIAGSMITVAGVTFSITIVAVAYVSSELGPRILRNFMRDTGNQVTLGTFIATFIYCLLVLRTVQDGSPAGNGGGVPEIPDFVPHIAVLTGLALAVASVGVLIFFIHHIPDSIHVSRVASVIGGELEKKIGALFVEERDEAGEAGSEGGSHSDPGEVLPPGFEEEAEAVDAAEAGYVQHLDRDLLVKAAAESDLVLRVERGPGDFVAPGRALVLAHPPGASNDVAHRVREAYHLGSRRTDAQDVLFPARELVEIAGRALSPGVNDPFTANTCADWLGAALELAARREPPPSVHRDGDGAVRVVESRVDFRLLLDESLGRMRPYAETDANAAVHLMAVLEDVARGVRREDDRRAVAEHADALLAGGLRHLAEDRDGRTLRDRHRGVVEALGRTTPSGDGSRAGGGRRPEGGAAAAR